MEFSDNQNLTFDEQGEQLSNIINSVLAINPGKAKVILVGHSMGGLAARSYLQFRFHDNNVLQLITIGTPHRGAEAAVQVQEACQSAIASILCNYFKNELGIEPFSLAMTQLRPDSLAMLGLNDLKNHPLPSRIHYTSIIGTGTPVIGLDGQDGDGIVTADSQNLGNIAGASILLPTAAKFISIKDKMGCDPGFTPDPIFGKDINPLPNETHTCETSDPVVQDAVLDAMLEYQLTLSMNQSTLTIGDNLILNLTSQNESTSAGDLYLGIQIPDGTGYIWDGTDFRLVFDGKNFLPNALKPFRANTTLTTSSEIILAGQIPAGLPAGTYTFLAVLARVGASPLDANNQLSNFAQVSFALSVPPPPPTNQPPVINALTAVPSQVTPGGISLVDF
jgi:hypothetical protein